MAKQEHPCANGLTPECFAAFPEWAKLAFCYKLLHVLIPASISRRLPKGLFPGRIGPGAILPAGWDPPPGVVVPPGYTVPERWIPFTYFILPEGMTWEQVFPPGWTAGDALPPGVSINANMVDVAGWSAGDPMPSGPGVNTAAILPAGWSPTNPPPAWFTPGGAGLPIPPGGALPPLYLPPGLQSPPHTAQPRSPISAVPWFYDDFDELDLAVWTKDVGGGGTATIENSELALEKPAGVAKTGLYRTDARGGLVNFNFSFELNIQTAGMSFVVRFYTGTCNCTIQFYQDNKVDLLGVGGCDAVTVDNYVGITHTWKINVQGTAAKLYKDGLLVCENHNFSASTLSPGFMSMSAGTGSGPGKILLDDFKIEEV